MASARDQKNFLDQLMATMGIIPTLETEKVSSLHTKSIIIEIIITIIIIIIIIIYNDKCYFVFFSLYLDIINIVIGNAITSWKCQ